MRRWAVTAIAEGPEGAVRISIMVARDEPRKPGHMIEPQQEAYELRAEASGLYRRTYGEWAKDVRYSYVELESARNEASRGGPISEEVPET